MTTVDVEAYGQTHQIKYVNNYQQLKQKIKASFSIAEEMVWKIYYQDDGDNIYIEGQNDFQNILDRISDQRISLFVQFGQITQHRQAKQILNFKDFKAKTQNEGQSHGDKSISVIQQRIKFDAKQLPTNAISQIKSSKQKANNVAQQKTTNNRQQFDLDILAFIEEPSPADSTKLTKIDSEQIILSQQIHFQSQTDNQHKTINRLSLQLPQDNDQIQKLFQKKEIKTEQTENILQRILVNQNDNIKSIPVQPTPKFNIIDQLGFFNDNPVNSSKTEEEYTRYNQLKQNNDLAIPKCDASVQTTQLYQKKINSCCVMCGKKQSIIRLYVYMHSCILCEICKQHWSLEPKPRLFRRGG